MDRNLICDSNRTIDIIVALRKESVDRNTAFLAARVSSLASLSARRAWIEITVTRESFSTSLVALRKESVDRNPVGVDAGYIARPSLSARRAWIEMVTVSLYSSCALVALRKESVDRNLRPLKCRLHLSGRSPQGERG